MSGKNLRANIRKYMNRCSYSYFKLDSHENERSSMFNISRLKFIYSQLDSLPKRDGPNTVQLKTSVCLIL